MGAPFAVSLHVRVRQRRETIEKFQANLERQLLAGKRIDQRFKHAGESWRCQTAKAFGESTKAHVASRHAVRIRQIHTQPEQSIESHASSRTVGGALRRRHGVYDQSWFTTRSGVPHDYFSRPATDPHDSPVLGSVPAIDRVPRSSPKRPCGQVQPKGR